MRSFLLACVLLALAAPAAVPNYDAIYDNARNEVEITTGLRYATLGAAINAVETNGWTSVLLPSGSHNIGTALDIDADDFELIFRRDTVISNLTSGAIGFGTFTGDNLRIEGAQFLIDTWVDDQVLLKVDGTISPYLSNIVVDCTASGDNDDANYMTAIHVEDSANERVLDCTVYPCDGMVPFKSLRGDAGIYRGNAVRVKANRKPTTGDSYAEVYVPYWIQGFQMGIFDGNVAYGLGATGNRIPYVLLIQWDSTLGSEQGHNRITNNRFEACWAERWVAHYGGQFTEISGNLFGQNEGAGSVFSELFYAGGNNVNNHAGIHVSSSDHTGGGQGSIHVMISDNNIHNVGGSEVPAISVAYGSRIFIQDNIFGLQNADESINIDAPTVPNDVYIRGNHFDGSGQDRGVIFWYLSGVTKYSASRYIVHGNTSDTLTNGIEPVYGFVGAGFDPFGYGFDDTLEVSANTISFQSVATSSSDYPKVLDSGSGFGSLQAGDYIYLTGAALINNQGFHKVRTAAAGELELEKYLYDFGDPINEVALNDLFTAAASPTITVQVYRRGFNSNLEK